MRDSHPLPSSDDDHYEESLLGNHTNMGMGQYLLIPFLVGWTSIYQLFWGSLGTRVLTHPKKGSIVKRVSEEFVPRMITRRFVHCPKGHLGNGPKGLSLNKLGRTWENYFLKKCEPGIRVHQICDSDLESDNMILQLYSDLRNYFLRVIPTNWHSIWHIFWHYFWHSIWHIFWHSIWHSFWRSIWPI